MGVKWSQVQFLSAPTSVRAEGCDGLWLVDTTMTQLRENSTTTSTYRVFAVLALRQNPRDATLSLNRFSVGVMLRVDGATPVTRGRTTCVLECAAHRTREVDIHAAITRSVVGFRRVVSHYPCRREGSNNTDENADHYQHGTAFAGCERVGRWGFASVDRRRLLRAANSTGLQ
jgi:hypothetical protein